MTTPNFAAETILSFKHDFKPKIAIVLGSGLGRLAEQMTDATTISYDEIPGFGSCTVAGHKGYLHLGYLHDLPLVCLQGRPHYYEGTQNSTFHTLIRSLKIIGVETFIATNAAGSLRENVPPGEVVLITDHINFHQQNPLIGPNDDSFGPRFISLEDLYNKNLREQFHRVAKAKDIMLHEGVYFSVLGPVFETPAEIRAFKILGGEVIGMSTIPEIIVAHHCGMKVAVVSAITNFASGMSEEKLSHELTLKGAKLAEEKIFNLVLGFLKNYH